MSNIPSRFLGCLLGLATGDAVGTTLEFRGRGCFEELTDMVGGGPFNLAPGEWTDDTSMALCLATSLIESGGMNAQDQMERYLAWQEDGYLSSNGTCFDIGITVSSAIRKFKRSGKPNAGSTDPRAAGNGSIMRLAPVPMYYSNNINLAEEKAAESSITTHGAPECVDACRLLSRIIVRALQGKGKADTLFGDKNNFEGSDEIVRIANGDYVSLSRDEIKGSGYVVESLNAALWCFYHTDNFREAILMAVNLGDDADTTAAICGQVAGAFYGVNDIPKGWLDKLVMKIEIIDLAFDLLDGRYFYDLTVDLKGQADLMSQPVGLPSEKKSSEKKSLLNLFKNKEKLRHNALIASGKKVLLELVMTAVELDVNQLYIATGPGFSSIRGYKGNGIVELSCGKKSLLKGEFLEFIQLLILDWQGELQCLNSRHELDYKLEIKFEPDDEDEGGISAYLIKIVYREISIGHKIELKIVPVAFSC